MSVCGTLFREIHEAPGLWWWWLNISEHGVKSKANAFRNEWVPVLSFCSFQKDHSILMGAASDSSLVAANWVWTYCPSLPDAGLFGCSAVNFNRLFPPSSPPSPPNFLLLFFNSLKNVCVHPLQTRLVLTHENVLRSKDTNVGKLEVAVGVGRDQPLPALCGVVSWKKQFSPKRQEMTIASCRNWTRRVVWSYQELCQGHVKLFWVRGRQRTAEPTFQLPAALWQAIYTASMLKMTLLVGNITPAISCHDRRGPCVVPWPWS